MSDLKLTLNISGKIGKFPLDAFETIYEMSGKDSGEGPKEVLVPQDAGGAGPAVSVALEGIASQDLLFICTDNQVTYEINADGVDRVIKANGFAVHPGNPVVTALVFKGNGSQDSKVNVFQLGDAGTPTPYFGGAFLYQEIAPADNPGGTPTFTLNWTPPPVAPPLRPVRVQVFVDGVLAEVADYTVAANQLTWAGAPLAGTERLTIIG